ncbi:hypothetical protein FOTG_17923 [Fusarium oxysporum f. sp. vasinfectum 25433]|uniref:Uncharacterized protein n=1 Tax=Fusarium oxysporum f. sp. vasinfectum 25433 TaxID=1089449 RepID=X0LYU5_FUSOX|nr:hypothetical protein FOTG_17923 [Fusarium oxysporum f. sp. vasinfectum 25433]
MERRMCSIWKIKTICFYVRLQNVFKTIMMKVQFRWGLTRMSLKIVHVMDTALTCWKTSLISVAALLLQRPYSIIG